MKDFLAHLFENTSWKDVFLGGLLAKLLDNNLPNLNYKNVWRFCVRAFEVFAFYGSMLLLLVALRLHVAGVIKLSTKTLLFVSVMLMGFILVKAMSKAVRQKTLPTPTQA